MSSGLSVMVGVEKRVRVASDDRGGGGQRVGAVTSAVGERYVIKGAPAMIYSSRIAISVYP